jgi:hypothetical protein
MTEILTRNRLAFECNVRIRDRINSGISWGTNNYPANSIPGWFANTNAGLAHTLSAGNFTGGASHAQQAKDMFRYIAQSMSGIRLVRIQIHRTGQGLIQDDTAVANTIYGTGDFASAAHLGSMVNGATMHIWGVSNDLDDLYNRYHQTARVNPLLLSNTICHVSCHVNCHCARGRR